jgi:AcrR family transcriptional regulator
MGIQERRTELRQALRDRILDASREIVGREGIAALSMRKIAEAIDYSPASLYLHFRSRADIARALRAEGHAQLLQAFLIHATIVDAAARLKAMGQAYVEFGLANPETYRLMLMETSGAAALADPGDADPGAAALAMMADAFVELRADGRLPAHAAPPECARALWANLHGIVALELTLYATPAVPQTSAETLAGLTLGAWFGHGAASSPDT